jgi:CheY-like chemotaxis protein
MRSKSGQKVDKVTREQFLKYLRDDLGHLYDPTVLRQSPLAALFGVASRFDASSALRSILTGAIKSLKPRDDEPSQSRSWRLHDSLFCCYVQRLSQQVVADQLGISARQLRREQRTALDVLTDQLWAQFDLERKLHEGTGVEESATAAATADGSAASEELAWLRDIPLEEPTDLDQALLAVLALAQPLAAQHRVHLETKAMVPLPSLAVHPVALNQTLLNLLSVAIPQSPGNQVRISARPLHWDVEIQVRGMKPSSGSPALSVDDAASLDIAHQLAELCRGKLALSHDEDAFNAILILPALERLPVLVVDDNADALQLLQRYSAGTRYRLIGTRDPEQVLSLAEKFSPQVIMLDVMMPQVDGWRVLGRLRQHPRTSHIPIVVCTILAQEALALSLGASAFIRKPVTRQAFLAALDHQVALAGTEPR